MAEIRTRLISKLISELVSHAFSKCRKRIEPERVDSREHFYDNRTTPSSAISKQFSLFDSSGDEGRARYQVISMRSDLNIMIFRDLAARNVLIGGDGRLKISDLGLSRTGVYVTSNRRKVPLRWLAIEAIRNSHYSNKSDVWSYAVLLWEIGTLGNGFH